jgi:hypothetical protein
VRVSEPSEVAGRRLTEGRRGDFEAALRRAEAARGERVQGEAGRAAGRVESRRAEAAHGEGQGGGGGPTGGDRGGSRVVGDQGAAAGRDDSMADAAQPLAPASGGAARPGVPPLQAEPGHAALVEAVRALPPVIETFGRSGREVLVLKLGGAIGVELRRAPGGVEVGLSVPAALRPAARAELLAICSALAARGVTVASAEVRGGAIDRWRRR